MDSFGPDKTLELIVISNGLLLEASELTAATRNIMLGPGLEGLFHVLNLVENLSRWLYLLRADLGGALEVLMTGLTLPELLMRIHFVKQQLIISSSLLTTVSTTLVKVVEQIVIHAKLRFTRLKMFSKLK